MKLFSMKKLIILSLLLSNITAKTITGEGSGTNQEEAKKDALADLSNSISVDVKSEFKSIDKILGDKYAKQKEKRIDLVSNLPIIGVKFNTKENPQEIKIIAKLDSKTSLKIYENELNRLAKNINSNIKKLNTKDKNTKYFILNKTLEDINNFNKYKVVAIILGAKNIPKLNITKDEIEISLKKYTQIAPTLKIASKLLTKDITQKNIYITAIKPYGSNEVTPFARILKNLMSQNLSTTKYSSKASYFLRGNYEVLKDGIFVTINLYDINNNIIKTNTIKLSPQAYKNIRYKPTTKTFDEAINSEFVKSGDLRVNIGFRGYNRVDGIDLTKGDKVDLVIKSNKPICYYIVGSVLHNKHKFSYILVPISYITGEDVNRAITIASDVEVSAPFGRENLKIVASTFKDKCHLKPPVCKENDEGYCVISNNPAKVIKTITRGLKLHKPKIQKATDSISWTSFEK